VGVMAGGRGRLDRSAATCRMLVRDVENDGAGFEEDEVATLKSGFIGGDLAEGLERQMLRLFHRLEGDQADVIGLTDLLQRPADPHVAREATSAIRGGFEGGDDGVWHGRVPDLEGYQEDV